MAEPLVFYNDRFIPQAQAHLTLHDAGFVSGATVSDLCRTFRHRLYRWEDHLDRFRKSCRYAQIGPAVSLDEVTAKAEELVRHNAALLAKEQDLALVMLATPGPVGYYLGEPGGAGDGPATFIMHTFPLPFARYLKLVEDGASLVVPTVRHVPAECIDPRVKQRSRLHWWLADRQAQRIEPGATALLLDMQGHITETAAANILVVRDGTVVSPLDHSILEGVSLKVVRALCAKEGIPFVRSDLGLYDCLAADEAMLASTPYCLAAVRQIQGHKLTFPGPVFRQLLAAWNESVEVDIHAQIWQAK